MQEPIEVHPYVLDEQGQTTFGESFQSKPYQYVGLLVERQSRSVMIMLRNDTTDEPIPCTFLGEKDIAKTIAALQQAIAVLRMLP